MRSRRGDRPDADNILEVVQKVRSLRKAKARFRKLQSTGPHLRLFAQVARRRREKHGTVRHHVIDRTSTH